jgi:hypothetical protein
MYVVSRVSRDSRKFQVIRPRASGVSRALWPRRTRRCIATGRASQRRRLLIMKGIGSARFSLRARTRRYHRTFIAILAAASLLGGGLFLVIFVLRPWSTLLFLCTMWTLATILTIWLLFHGVRDTVTHWETHKRPSLSPEHKPPHALPAHDSPATPMPAAPLVRVLETVDLSSTDVEHFVDAPDSQVTLPVDELH